MIRLLILGVVGACSFFFGSILQDEGDIERAATWFRDNYGSYDVLRVGLDYCLSSITVSVDTDTVLQRYYTEGERLCALVVWRKWE